MATSDIRVQKGNPYVRNIKFLNKSDGSPMSLVDRTVFFTVKHLTDYADNDDGAIIKKDITVHTDAAGGETQLALTAAQNTNTPGKYKCDFRVYELDDTQVNTATAYFYIDDIVTKRTS